MLFVIRCRPFHVLIFNAVSIPPDVLCFVSLPPRPRWRATPALQIANVGFLDVNNHTVLKAVASDTLFIHGSLTGGGGSMFNAPGAVRVASPALLLGESGQPAKRCKPSCGTLGSSALKAETGVKTTSADEGTSPAGAGALRTSTICDRSCDADAERGPRFGGHLCGAGNVSLYGEHCRTCYNDLEEARAAENLLAEEERIEFKRRRADKIWRSGKEQKKRRVLRRGGIGWEEREGVGGEESEGQRGGDVGEEKPLERGGEDGGEDDDDDDDVDDENTMAERQRHVIMCDTLVPPPATSGCSLKCQKKDDTVSSG